MSNLVDADDDTPRRIKAADRKVIMKRIIRNESKSGDSTLVMFHLTKKVGQISHMVRLAATEAQLNRLFEDAKNRRPFHQTEKMLYEIGGDMIPVKIVHGVSRAYKCSMVVRGALSRSCPLCQFIAKGGRPEDFKIVEVEYDEARQFRGHAKIMVVRPGAIENSGIIHKLPEGVDPSVALMGESRSFYKKRT